MRQVLDRVGHVDPLESAIANYELAFRMQIVGARADGYSPANRRRRGSYTVSMRRTRRRGLYALECLLARRLVERGVRFVELTCPEHAATTAGISTAD